LGGRRECKRSNLGKEALLEEEEGLGLCNHKGVAKAANLKMGDGGERKWL